MYRVYVRNWWRESTPDDREYPGLVGHGGARKHTIAKVRTEEEAHAIAERYNLTHKPGRLSRKAEYTEE